MVVREVYILNTIVFSDFYILSWFLLLIGQDWWDNDLFFFLHQGVCKQCVVYQNTVTTRSAANGQARSRASEFCTDSEAVQ